MRTWTDFITWIDRRWRGWRARGGHAWRRWALHGARPVVVYYDDTCGFCRRCRQLVDRADAGRNVRWIGSSQRQHHTPVVSEEEVRASLVVFDTEGRKSSYAAAVARVCAALPWPWRIGVVVDAPGVRRISNAAYGTVARRRRWLSARFGLVDRGTARGVAEAEPAAPACLEPQRTRPNHGAGN